MGERKWTIANHTWSGRVSWLRFGISLLQIGVIAQRMTHSAIILSKSSVWGSFRRHTITSTSCHQLKNSLKRSPCQPPILWLDCRFRLRNETPDSPAEDECHADLCLPVDDQRK